MEVRIDEERIEKELQKKLSKRKFYIVWMVVGFLIIVIPCIVVHNIFNPVTMLLAVVGSLIGFSLILVGWILYAKAGGEYMKHYKQSIVIPVVQAMYPGAVYLPWQGITQKEYEKMHLRSLGTARSFYRSEDLIKGRCKGIAFRQADVVIEHSSEQKHTVYEVDGQLREFEFAKPITGTVLLGKRGKLLDVQPGMHRIEFENVEFNSKYDVYAEDEHSAFYIITPQFMEYLLMLYMYDDDIYMSFDGERLRLLQSGRGGVFEARGDLLSVSTQISNACNDLKQIEEVIDLLHLEAQ